jgi:xylulose-5-phosphate/fructose-6-phosphate phosphoketolase
VDRVASLEPIAAHAHQEMRDKLVEHKEYVQKHGQDMPEILDWKWKG